MLVLGRFVLFRAKKQIKIATFEVSRGRPSDPSRWGDEVEEKVENYVFCSPWRALTTSAHLLMIESPG